MENVTLTDQEIKQFEAAKEQYSKMDITAKIKFVSFALISLLLLVIGFIAINNQGRQFILWGVVVTLITLTYYLVVHGNCKKLSKTEVQNLTITEGTLKHRPIRPKNDPRNFTIKEDSSKKHYIGINKKHKDFDGIKVRVFHHENHIFVVSYIV